jgi:hypothetical protein
LSDIFNPLPRHGGIFCSAYLSIILYIGLNWLRFYSEETEGGGGNSLTQLYHDVSCEQLRTTFRNSTMWYWWNLALGKGKKHNSMLSSIKFIAILMGDTKVMVVKESWDGFTAADLQLHEHPSGVDLPTLSPQILFPLKFIRAFTLTMPWTFVKTFTKLWQTTEIFHNPPRTGRKS